MTRSSGHDRLPGATGEPGSAAPLAEAMAEASAALSDKLDPQELHRTAVELAARL
ncbi:hypothetical protein [Sorangium sp. So ce1335]|uniref:hypothetical protein n=1 Tax=Sorangium sp. So ce1335 TaxID=3133335 RepID=UPI003F6191D0